MTEKHISVARVRKGEHYLVVRTVRKGAQDLVVRTVRKGAQDLVVSSAQNGGGEQPYTTYRCYAHPTYAGVGSRATSSRTTTTHPAQQVGTIP